MRTGTNFFKGRNPLALITLLFSLLCIPVYYAHAHDQNAAVTSNIDISTFPPIEDDVQALSEFSQKAKSAGLRLIERGDEILSVAHGVLADPGAPYPQRMQLLYVLGQIANPESATEIIHSITDMPNNRYLYQDALLALSNFEPTDEIKSFVNHQLEITKRDPIIQRSALNYYAKQQDGDASQWIQKYALNNEANPEVRYAALYMAGMNNEQAVKEPIASVLDSTTNTTRQYYLLLGYANVATLEEFNSLVENKNLSPDSVNKAREFLMYRLANPADRKKSAPELLNSTNTQLKQAVIKNLISEKDADTLASNWKSGDSYLRSAVKRSGYEIDLTGEGAVFKQHEHPHNDLPQRWLALALVVIFLIAVFVYMQRRSNR